MEKIISIYDKTIKKQEEHRYITYLTREATIALDSKISQVKLRIKKGKEDEKL